MPNIVSCFNRAILASEFMKRVESIATFRMVRCRGSYDVLAIEVAYIAKGVAPARFGNDMAVSEISIASSQRLAAIANTSTEAEIIWKLLFDI